jgi:tryptophanyl-tRNA synthetase
MKTVFSGIQPTGELHLGNYLGAVRNWVALQDEYRCIFCVVDYHALTQDYDAKEMAKRVSDMVIDLIALGIDPDRSLVFLQSMVPEHTELGWVLTNVTGFGDLERMTQFKDKSASQPENVNVGLFQYPVLQAADILLYKAERVPVGQDQVQHIELARRIARSFNHRWGKVFPECEPLLTNLPKLLGLDGKKKMSKSLGNHIPLSVFAQPDPGKALKKLLGRAVTDEKRVAREDPGNPDDCNVATMHRALSSAEDLAWMQEGCTTAAIGCVDCKKMLLESLLRELDPIRAKAQDLYRRPEHVREVLIEGGRRARAVAREMMSRVREVMGIKSDRI